MSLPPLPRQLLLPLPPVAEPRGPFLPDTSNAVARAWLAEPARWPAGRFCLWGPEGTGKSHLLADTAARFGWRLWTGADLPALPEPAPTAVDDADCAPEQALLHLINANAAHGLPLLLAARAAPARWPTRLPDLKSRLAATAAAALEEPSEALLAALLAAELAARQLRLPPALQGWLLARLPRQARAVHAAAARIDRWTLATGRTPSRALLQAALADLEGFAAGDDDGVSGPAAASPDAPALV